MKKKIWPISRKKRQSIESVPEEVQKLYLLDKDFKSAFKIRLKN